MQRILNTLSAVAGAAIAGLTALPLEADVRAYAVFALGLVVIGINVYLGKPSE